MPGTPRVIGPNANVPDAVDVEGVSGEIVTVPRRSLPIFGLAFEEGDAAVQAMQPQSEPIAQAPAQQAAIDAVPDVPLAPVQGAAQAAAAAPAPAPAQATGGAAPTSADLAPMAEVQRARSERERVAQEHAQQEAAIAQRQARLNLVAAAMEGDPAAVTHITESGDPELARMLARAQALGVGQRSGTSGQRARQTTTFQGYGRAMSPAEQSLDAALVRSRRDGEERDLDATVRAMKREADLARDTAEAMRKVEEDLAIEEQRAQQAERVRRAELDRRQRELDRTVAEVSSRQIDPGRLYGRGETGARLTAAIGFFLGGLAEAFGAEGATQQVLGIINRAIDRDIEAQRGNISAGQANVQARRGLLQDMRARFGDEKAAEGATRAAMLADAERQLQRLRQSATSDVQRAQIDQMLGELQAQRAQAARTVLISNLGTTTTTLERRSGGFGGRRQIDAAALLRASEAEPSVEGGERGELAQVERTAESTLEDIDRAIQILRNDETALTGAVSRFLVPDAAARAMSETRRELDDILTRVSLPTVAQAFGAANDEQVRMIRNDVLGLSADRSPDELIRNLTRLRQNTQRDREAGILGVSPETRREMEARRPSVRRDVALGTGRAEDVEPTFRED